PGGCARGPHLSVGGAFRLPGPFGRLRGHLSSTAVLRGHARRPGFHPPRPMLRPTVGSGLVISWAGMRGIVSLAAALALPAAFPFRGLIVLIAFAVVLGTLSIQGLTLGPLFRTLDLRDDDPVGQEVSAARARALRAGLAQFEDDRSEIAIVVRQELVAHLGLRGAGAEESYATRIAHTEIHHRAIVAARTEIYTM